VPKRDLTGIETRLDSTGREQYRPYVSEHGKKIRGSWTYSYPEAKGLRARMVGKIVDGVSLQLSVGRLPVLRDAAENFIDGARSGDILSRKRELFAPATIRCYDEAFHNWIFPDLGEVRVDALRRSQCQRVVDAAAIARSSSGARNVATALRSLYAYLLKRHDDLVNPCIGLDLPRPSAPRERIASPEEMHALLTALPKRLALPYALAFYTGLRRGEMQALALDRIDLDAGWIDVEWGLDPRSGFRRPKSRAGKRSIPIFERLRPFLADLPPCKVPSDVSSGPGTLLLASRTGAHGARELGSSYVRNCTVHWERAGLQPIGLHEGRHSFATMLVRAGYDVGLIQEWIGHAWASTTLDIYNKHRGRTDRTALAEKLDAYLA
jgi:integrase